MFALIPLYSEGGVRVEIPEANGKVGREVLGGEELSVQEVFPVTIHLLPVISGLAAMEIMSEFRIIVHVEQRLKIHKRREDQN